jgi:Tfp pilus assembly protein PilO
MAMTDRDKRALKILGMATVPAVILMLWPTGETAAPAAGTGKNAVVAASNDDPLALEHQLTRLRKKQAELPVKESNAKDLLSQLNNREKGLIRADTLPQAQAQLAQLVRQTGRAQGIDFRSVVMGTPRTYGGEYGEIVVTAATECKIEQIVNFMAELTKLPELVATEDVRISTMGAKEKTLSLSLTICGLVPKKLVPEKKGGI